METRRSTRMSLRSYLENMEDNIHYKMGDEDVDNIDIVFIPDGNDSDVIESDSDNEDSDSENEEDIQGGVLEYFNITYDNDQKLLEANHQYDWQVGEYETTLISIDEEILLSDEKKLEISKMSAVQKFELFFSQKLKQDIIDATLENGYRLSLDQFDVFIGLLIASILNPKKRQRDYWSKDKLLRHDFIATRMSRNEFFKIKKFLKYSKKSDENSQNKVWRVQNMVDTFRQNIQQFGFFSTKLSVDESMIKFFGRCGVKQFMRNKPIRFGLKLWAVCTISGFLLDFQIYCGKNDAASCQQLKNCNLGTRVVMNMLQELLKSPRDILSNYHVCFDNFFTSPDLILHLQKLGLKATGTVRQNRVCEVKRVNNKKKRVTVPVSLSKKSCRGEHDCKFDVNSGMNYISVMDSKVVSLLTTAAGVTPKTSLDRYSSQEKKKVGIQFPQGFKIYNKHMGGVDLHDQHCNDVKIGIHKKKWTWTVFLRLIEASITNATVLHNLCTKEKKGTYDFVRDIARVYMSKRDGSLLKRHSIETLQNTARVCWKCPKKIRTYCFDCKEHFCTKCFRRYHGFHECETRARKEVCCNPCCKTRTMKFCTICDSYFCKMCFEGKFHEEYISNTEEGL